MFGLVLAMLLAIAIASIWAFVLGVGALLRARQSHGERAEWLLLALLLCEPLLSAPLMACIFWGDWAWSHTGWTTALWLTAPMAVLLLTLLGLRQANVSERKRRIAALGVGRWALALLAILALFNNLVLPLLPLALTIAGVGILWYSAAWGREQLRIQN